MLEELKEKVCEANLLLPKYGLVTFTRIFCVGKGCCRGGKQYNKINN